MNFPVPERHATNRGTAPTRVAILITLALTSSADGTYAQTLLIGRWVGSAVYQGEVLPLEVTFEPDGGNTRGFVTSSRQKAFRYPLRNLTADGTAVAFELPSDIGSFAFNGNVSGDSLTGTWNLFGVTATVSMQRTVVARYALYARSCYM